MLGVFYFKNYFEIIFNIIKKLHICDMLKIDRSMQVWITSDTHYGHKNICRGVTDWRTPEGEIPVHQTRPFDTLDEMNDAIVGNINNLVGEDDILLHLGDWSFGGFDNIGEFRERVNCKNVILFLGNHDHHIEDNKNGCRALFAHVGYYDTIKYGDWKFPAMHYPITSWDGLMKGRVHLHGHTHLPAAKRITNGRRMDVGMDGHPEFRPYDLVNEVLIPLSLLPVGSELGDDDHHTDGMKKVVG
jgi:calcineurin-like phosphoesterase family protein